MKWSPSGIGAEPKKLLFLGGLVVVGAYLIISNRTPSGDASAPAARPADSVSPVPGGQRTAATRPAGRGRGRAVNSPREFRPSFKVAKDVEVSTVDPTLHLPLLARLQDVKPEGGTRSLFEIASAPPAELKVKEPAAIVPTRAFVGPMQPPPPPGPPPKPNAPPIPLKFYGFVNPHKANIKRAFFLKGEDIIIAGEGELIDKRYKIVRIGVNSAVVEDTQFENGGNNPQTLPLEAEMAG